ncbi:MAG: hypothetical protein C0402_08075 [Thermodesulfovibrio sp.]|nr:hypothetical protein [Thermodesulfovibrio sp.]
MIRRGCTAGFAGLLLLFAVWHFYARGLQHDPYAEYTAVKVKQKAGGSAAQAAAPVAFQPGWSADIHEKNLFSPSRTYREPKPVVAAPLVPVEPPKRPEVVLKGVILDSFGEYVAYIEVDKAKSVPMRKGDKTDNIELIDISGRKAVLKWNSEIMNLSLDKIKTIENPKAVR